MLIRLYCFIRFIKSICFIFIIGSIALLSGCNQFMHRLGYEHIKTSATSSQCLTSDILITNLNVDPSQQHYQLPDGTVCTGANYATE